MDNKKWGKRFSTIFWWSLAILPFVIPLIQFIGFHLTFNSGISTASDLVDYHSNVSGSYVNIFNSFNNSSGNTTLAPFAIPFIKTAFFNLFRTLTFSDFYSSILGNAFGWMASVFFFHVIFDVTIWIFRLIHSWLDRWCVE